MKTIGLIGGMSWESSIIYYKVINERVAEKLGGLHSARSIMFSLDFDDIEQLQIAGRWDDAAQKLVVAGRSLQAAGVDFLVICTNTMHIAAAQVEKEVPLPLLHIADATASRIRRQGLTKIGLLGTRFTMEREFYRERMAAEHGLDMTIPSQPDRDVIHGVIYDELCKGIIDDRSRAEFRRIIRGLANDGAEAVILGCTEITLLVSQADSPIPTFDTTLIHAEAAADYALESSSDIPTSKTHDRVLEKESA